MASEKVRSEIIDDVGKTGEEYREPVLPITGDIIQQFIDVTNVPKPVKENLFSIFNKETAISNLDKRAMLITLLQLSAVTQYLAWQRQCDLADGLQAEMWAFLRLHRSLYGFQQNKFVELVRGVRKDGSEKGGLFRRIFG